GPADGCLLVGGCRPSVVDWNAQTAAAAAAATTRPRAGRMRENMLLPPGARGGAAAGTRPAVRPGLIIPRGSIGATGTGYGKPSGPPIDRRGAGRLSEMALGDVTGGVHHTPGM